MGVDSTSGVNFLASLKTSLSGYLTNPIRTTDVSWEPVLRSPRLQELAGRVIWAICTDNASEMHQMGQAASYKGLVLFSFWCFAHLTSLIRKEFCVQPLFAPTLRKVVESFCFSSLSFVRTLRCRLTAPRTRRLARDWASW